MDILESNGKLDQIKKEFCQFKKKIPDDISVVLAVKTRSAEEVSAAIEAGASEIGHNYVQEAQKMQEELGDESEKIKWHMIGYLQTNKISKALEIFDVIQTVDSQKKAKAIDKRAANAAKKIEIFLEINIADEDNKHGFSPDIDKIKEACKEISGLNNVNLTGVMTMGPNVYDPEMLRPYFKKAKEIFDEINSMSLDNVSLKHLSMGMSDSYEAAIEEGSNMIRPGTVIFGNRE